MIKYNELRNRINHGDIILFRGRTLRSRLIQWFDGGYYCHMGLIFMAGERRLILDSTAPGVHPYFLSERMKQYSDFCLIRPIAWSPEAIRYAVDGAMVKAEHGIKYDFKLLLQIALYRKTGLEERLNSGSKDICSEFIRRYTRHLIPRPCCFEKPPLLTGFITPWDFILYADSNFEILFDRSDKSRFRKVM